MYKKNRNPTLMYLVLNMNGMTAGLAIYCFFIVGILDIQNLVSQVRFQVPPFHSHYDFIEVQKKPEKFYEKMSALLSHEKINATEDCTDIICHIKTAKLSHFRLKRTNARPTHVRNLRVLIEIYIYFEYQDTGWIDIIVKNDSIDRSITETVSFSSKVLLSKDEQFFPYTWNSMRTVFLSISCPPLNYSSVSRISIMIRAGNEQFKVGKHCKKIEF